MGRLSRKQILQHVKPLIIKELNAYLTRQSKNYFTVSDLQKILKLNRRSWTLPAATTYLDFINFLLDKNVLNLIKIKLPGYRITERYTMGTISEYELALSINKESYLSHYTALYLHELTENVPKNIYTNKEQVKKANNPSHQLRQESIDQSFSRPMRITNQIAQFNDFKVYLLNGKNVDRIGVTDITLEKLVLPITNMERTLIDACVRPDYAGGAYEVLNAFKAAKGKISVNKLLATLKKMDFIYPYHQVIGFYLEKAGYEEKLLRLFDKLEKNYNFYLSYAMKNPDFSPRWKLYFPNRF